MNEKRTTVIAIVIALCLSFASQFTFALPLDFEDFTDSSPLTNEIIGFTFSGGTVLTAGVGLNEIDFPPRSGTNVLAALLGSLTVIANVPFGQFSAYFTFDEQLMFSGFDVAGNLLFSFNSPINSNLGSNSLIGFAAPEISSLVIATQGSTPFTMDDLDVSTVTVTVPEPGTLALLPLGLLAAAYIRRRRNERA